MTGLNIYIYIRIYIYYHCLSLIDTHSLNRPKSLQRIGSGAPEGAERIGPGRQRYGWFVSKCTQILPNTMYNSPTKPWFLGNGIMNPYKLTELISCRLLNDSSKRI
jgi:hypothetical protein